MFPIMALAAAAAGQVQWSEAEPNDSKATATFLNGVAAGDLIVGYTAGSAGATGGSDSPDYFRVRLADPGPGIFRYRLIPEAGATGLTLSVRGLRQDDLGAGVGGAAVPESDVPVQNAMVPLAGAGVTFDAAGAAEVFIRLHGSGLTTEGYRLRVHREAVVPQEWPRQLEAGAITIGIAPGASADIDFWVCDASGSPLPGFGNDQPGRLTRTIPPGEYLVAWSMANLAVGLPSPSDDGWRRGAMMDSIGAFCSFAEVGASAPLRIDDAAGAEIVPISLGPREIRWVRLRIESAQPECAPCAADFDRSGGVDGEDIGAFFAAWQAGEVCGDVDGSGGVDGEDIGWFFGVWQAGGC